MIYFAACKQHYFQTLEYSFCQIKKIRVAWTPGKTFNYQQLHVEFAEINGFLTDNKQFNSLVPAVK